MSQVIRCVADSAAPVSSVVAACEWFGVAVALLLGLILVASLGGLVFDMWRDILRDRGSK